MAHPRVRQVLFDWWEQEVALVNGVFRYVVMPIDREKECTGGGVEDDIVLLQYLCVSVRLRLDRGSHYQGGSPVVLHGHSSDVEMSDEQTMRGMQCSKGGKCTCHGCRRPPVLLFRPIGRIVRILLLARVFLSGTSCSFCQKVSHMLWTH